MRPASDQPWIRCLAVAVAMAAHLSGCGGIAETGGNTAAQPPMQGSRSKTYVYHCPDNYRFTARLEEGERLWLFLPERTLELSRTPSASGEKYSDGGNLILWLKGEQGLLETEAGTRRQCRNDAAAAVWEHAKLSGVDFRAAGNEPGWYLEIRENLNILLVSDYGQSRWLFEAPIQTGDEAAPSATIYQATLEAHELTVRLEPGPCRDSMSEQIFPVRVEIQMDKHRLVGCGQPLH